MNPKAKHTNRLINESSPYLLQHAHNPVDWHAWNDETLRKALENDKMLLISIGYSACHWCHVMENESFENEHLARIMNEHFICVKVDREERPDVDAVYMNAVQLIHGNGGWPLNCFALPDGRPFYGGTYFQPQQWEALLKNVAELYRDRRNELEAQAQQVLDGIQQDNLIDVESEKTRLDEKVPEDAIKKWKVNFDLKQGGARGAPKFPLPSNIMFLMEFAHRRKDNSMMRYVELTLDKMAMGGIYDQVGGGFARYAVDAEWKVPHFEKMLYDNAQLISLYANASLLTGKDRFLTIAIETADFVLRELTSPEGAFYSALDADSEGVEGKFYAWTKAEFEACLGDDSRLFEAYFEIDGEAYWEDGKNVLMRKYHPGAFAKAKGLAEEEFAEKLNDARQKLYDEREKRVRPGLDDKSLTSWNAMMIKALAQLHIISGQEKYLDAALKAAELIRKELISENHALLHNYKNGKASVTGFLEDYAHTADAALELYQVTMDEKWMQLAADLTGFVTDYFFDRDENLFWFTDQQSDDLVARKKELYDNVIPASNSVMGHVLFRLSKFYGSSDFAGISRLMAERMSSLVKQYPSSFANWAKLILYQTIIDFKEIVVTGPGAQKTFKELYRYPLAGRIIAGAESHATLPVFKNRIESGKNVIYICSGNVCKRPVETVEEAIRQLG